MKTGVQVEISIDSNGIARECEIMQRQHDRSVYVRIHQIQQDCYLELREVAELYREMVALSAPRTDSAGEKTER